MSLYSLHDVVQTMELYASPSATMCDACMWNTTLKWVISHKKKALDGNENECQRLSQERPGRRDAFSLNFGLRLVVYSIRNTCKGLPAGCTMCFFGIQATKKLCSALAKTLPPSPAVDFNSLLLPSFLPVFVLR